MNIEKGSGSSPSGSNLDIEKYLSSSLDDLVKQQQKGGRVAPKGKSIYNQGSRVSPRGKQSRGRGGGISRPWIVGRGGRADRFNKFNNHENNQNKNNTKNNTLNNAINSVLSTDDTSNNVRGKYNNVRGRGKLGSKGFSIRGSLSRGNRGFSSSFLRNFSSLKSRNFNNSNMYKKVSPISKTIRKRGSSYTPTRLYTGNKLSHILKSRNNPRLSQGMLARKNYNNKSMVNFKRNYMLGESIKENNNLSRYNQRGSANISLRRRNFNTNYINKYNNLNNNFNNQLNNQLNNKINQHLNNNIMHHNQNNNSFNNNGFNNIGNYKRLSQISRPKMDTYEEMDYADENDKTGDILSRMEPSDIDMMTKIKIVASLDKIPPALTVQRNNLVDTNNGNNQNNNKYNNTSTNKQYNNNAKPKSLSDRFKY